MLLKVKAIIPDGQKCPSFNTKREVDKEICKSWRELDPIKFFCHFSVFQCEKWLGFMHVRLMKVVNFLRKMASLVTALLGQSEVTSMPLEEKKDIHHVLHSSGKELVTSTI